MNEPITIINEDHLITNSQYAVRPVRQYSSSKKRKGAGEARRGAPVVGHQLIVGNLVDRDVECEARDDEYGELREQAEAMRTVEARRSDSARSKKRKGAGEARRGAPVVGHQLIVPC